MKLGSRPLILNKNLEFPAEETLDDKTDNAGRTRTLNVTCCRAKYDDDDGKTTTDFRPSVTELASHATADESNFANLLDSNFKKLATTLGMTVDKSTGGEFARYRAGDNPAAVTGSARSHILRKMRERDEFVEETAQRASG